LSGLRGFEHFASWWNGTGFMRLRGLKYDDAMNFRWTPDLTTRNRQPELMDDPGLDEGLHHGALRGLARLNVVTRSSHLLWVAIRRLADEVPDRPLRILDVASGGGDVAIGLWRKALRHGVDVRITGCDISPVAIRHAQEQATARQASVEFIQVDALAGELPSDFDVVTCSLFLHHLEESDAVELFRRMASAARHLVLVNDLVRSRLNYLTASVASRLLSRSNIVHVDAPLSVQAAFTPHEAIRLAERAGLSGSTITQYWWQQRMVLSWRRPPGPDTGPDIAASTNIPVEEAATMDWTPVGKSVPAVDQQRAGTMTEIQEFGDYQLLEEIARGGMGVVYKARQTSLNRIVAVKMILSGKLAGGEEVQRFYNEAEAAANLQHPNIVAIHEVGEIAGQHFFSMDFVEGPSFSMLLKAGRLPGHRAAAYVRTIAEAIHYAHQQGTLHRDLKPQNILIDQNDQPRVTDFGLAKRVDGGSDLTASGAVLGTPSYMPPEQAVGELDRIGPASDVYSLGAILFESLTGRPPFQAESTLDLLRDVIEAEPPALRTVDASLPRDLETICLKCLEKDPARRYPTAAALARDLDLYLLGEPILARPLSLVGRLVRWARDKPVLAITYIGNVTFYSFHLIAMLILKIPEESGFFHWFISGVVVVWVIVATGLQRLIDSDRWRSQGLYGIAALSVLMMTSLFTVDKGPSSAPITAYLVMVGGAALLGQLPGLVWFMTGLTIAGYLWVVAYAHWFRPEYAVSIDSSLAYILSLLVMGLIMHLLIRRMRMADVKQDRKMASMDAGGEV